MSDNQQQLHGTRHLLFSFRAAVSFLTFFGFMNLYMQRINLSVAIVCMVNHTDLALNSDRNKNNSLVSFSDCDRKAAVNSTRDMEDGELKWSKAVQGLVLGSFFWGYITTQVIGGRLSLKLGGKNVFGGAMLLGALITLVIPTAARAHYGAMIALRIMLGMCGGVVFPASHTVFSRWVPPSERSRLIGIAAAGANAGTVMSLFFGGYLCRYGFSGGWPSVFYVFGIIGIVWVALWTIFVSDSPRSNRWISKKERIYIERSLQHMITQKKVHAVPWRSLLTSLPVWAVVVTHTCSNWANYMFLTQLPSYLREVIGATITKNGLLSGIPYVLKTFSAIAFSFMSDLFVKKKVLGPNANRRLFNSLGQVPLALFALTITFLPCSQKDFIIALLIIGIAFNGAHQAAGYFVNPSDIAPNFAGVIFGISNTFATVPGMIAPSIVAAMTPQRSRQQWNNVFYLTAAIYILGALFFIIFSSAELQDWGKPREEAEEERTKREQETHLQHEDSDVDQNSIV